MKTELKQIRPQLDIYNYDYTKLEHELGSNFKNTQENINRNVDFHLTVLLQGEIIKNLSTLSQENKNSTSRLLSDLFNHPKLIHQTLLKERLEDLNNILTGQGSFRFPFNPLEPVYHKIERFNDIRNDTN